LDLRLTETRARKSHDYREVSFRKAPFSKRFPSTPKRKSGRFQIPPV